MRKYGYDTAQICLNGHVISGWVESHPQHSEDFCRECGEPTITSCQACDSKIRGYYLPRGGRSFTRPSFCHDCGEPHPWTEAALKAAKELADEQDNLTPEDRETLKKSLDDIVRDTPYATVAATRFKRLVAKAGKGAAEAFRNILIDVLSDAVKNQIWQ